MRTSCLLMLVVLPAVSYSCSKSPLSASLTPIVAAREATQAPDSRKKIDFKTDVEPILKAKCHSCHFSGGKMYDKLPFDRPETVKRLGNKLFTRIADENDRKIIREFLAQ